MQGRPALSDYQSLADFVTMMDWRTMRRPKSSEARPRPSSRRTWKGPCLGEAVRSVEHNIVFDPGRGSWRVRGGDCHHAAKQQLVPATMQQGARKQNRWKQQHLRAHVNKHLAEDKDDQDVLVVDVVEGIVFPQALASSEDQGANGMLTDQLEAFIATGSPALKGYLYVGKVRTRSAY